LGISGPGLYIPDALSSPSHRKSPTGFVLSSSVSRLLGRRVVIPFNNNNNRDDAYDAVIMAKSLQEFTRFTWWMQTQRRGGRQPSDQANQLRLKVRQKGMAATAHIHHRHFIITQPESWYSFYHPTEGGRMTRSRHCIKGVKT